MNVSGASVGRASQEELQWRSSFCQIMASHAYVIKGPMHVCVSKVTKLPVVTVGIEDDSNINDVVQILEKMDSKLMKQSNEIKKLRRLEESTYTTRDTNIRYEPKVVDLAISNITSEVQYDFERCEFRQFFRIIGLIKALHDCLSAWFIDCMLN